MKNPTYSCLGELGFNHHPNTKCALGISTQEIPQTMTIAPKNRASTGLRNAK